MALYRCMSGGSNDIKSTLLGSLLNLSTTTATSLTLSQDMDEFFYLLICMDPFDGDSYITQNGRQGLALIKPSILKTMGSLTLNYHYGANPPVLINAEVTYVSDTSITIKESRAQSRSFYVYGIK